MDHSGMRVLQHTINYHDLAYCHSTLIYDPESVGRGKDNMDEQASCLVTYLLCSTFHIQSHTTTPFTPTLFTHSTFIDVDHVLNDTSTRYRLRFIKLLLTRGKQLKIWLDGYTKLTLCCSRLELRDVISEDGVCKRFSSILTPKGTYVIPWY